MRKVLSFVLVLSLVLGSFSMAFAATPAGLSDIAGNANENAIQVVNDLGIVAGYPDGTFGPAKAVTRAEFAAMITRALAIPESALTGYTATTFKDVAGYQWAIKYLAFAESKGIMLGDGQGNVMPGNTITVNEAVTMALRAIGYTSNSDYLVGTWPANYVTMAQNVKLYDDVAALATVDRASAAQIIYNLLTVEKVKVNAEGSTTPVNGKNLLNTGLGCVDGTKEVLDNGNYSSATLNINKIIGAYGTPYTKNGKLVAFVKASDSKFLTGKKDGDYFKTADGTKYTIADTTTTAGVYLKNTVITSTQAITIGAIDALDERTYDDDGTLTIFAEVSGLTIKNVYSVLGWVATDNSKISTAELEDITADKMLLQGKFDKDSNNAIDTDNFALYGASSLSDIKKDNIVYIYEATSNVIRQVEVGTQVVTGKVTEKNETAGVTGSAFIYVNGTKYSADKVKDSTGDDLPALNADVKLFLDYAGRVYAFESTGAASKYLVAKAWTGTTGSAFTDNKITSYTSDDAPKTFTFVDWDDVDFLGIPYTSVSGVTAPALYGYDVDSTGKIDTLNVSAQTVLTASGTYLQSDKVMYIAGKAYNVASDVVVFTYTGNGLVTSTGITYDVTTIGKVDKGVFTATLQAIISDGTDVKALLISANDADGTTNDVYGVVNTVSDMKSGDDTIQKVVGFVGGVAATNETTVKSVSNTVSKTLGLWKYELDGSGKIKTATLITGQDTFGTTAATRVTAGAVITMAGISDDGTVFTANGGEKFTVQANATVYEAVYVNGTFDSFAVSKLSNISSKDVLYLYDTKTGSDHNGVANVIIFQAL